MSRCSFGLGSGLFQKSRGVPFAPRFSRFKSHIQENKQFKIKSISFFHAHGFSPVLSEGISAGALGFLRKTPNLFNVAITRARAALIVVGDKSAALNCDVDYLSQFATYIEHITSRNINEQDSYADDLGPIYPPVSSPELVSEWERIFYKAIYKAGIRSIPQYSVEKYLLDFAIIDGNRRLNIEIDGERYHRNWDGELCRRDQIRNQRLMELGWDVLRFWVYQIRDDIDSCINRVLEWIGKP